jgi:PAS domain S-box-containing protein
MTGPSTYTILNVDDDEANRSVKSHILRRAGYRVVEAKNGAEALRLVQESSPQLVVLDVKLPDVSGTEVCRRIKANPDSAGIMVLQVSASHVTTADRIEGLEGGADSYLTEPVEAEELVACVKALLRLSQRERENRELLAQVQEREERLRLALDAAKLGTWDHRPDTGEVVRDEHGYRQFGLDVTTTDYAAVIARIHPEDRDAVNKSVEQALAGEGGDAHQIQFRVVWPDGSVHWLASHGRVYFSEPGNKRRAVRFIGVNMDITEQKRVEAALDAGRRELQLIIDAVPALITLIDSRFCYVLNNRAYEDWFQKPLHKITGRHLAEVLGAAVFERIRPRLERALLGEVVAYDDFLRFESGQTRWIHANYIPTRNIAGTVDGVVALVNDISERKRTEDVLRENEERLRLALKAANAGVWELDLATNRIFWSDDFFMYGYDESTPWTYETWTASVHPDDRDRIEADLRQRLSSDQSEFQHEFRIIHPQGGVRWIIGLGRIHRDSSGRALRASGINIDITDRKHAEEALKEADRRKDEFLATLAHELRNPLAPIRNALQILRLKVPPTSELEWAQNIIDQQIQQMIRLIDDLLDVSRITRDKLDLRKETVELAKVVESAIETSRPLIEQNRHQLTVSLPSEPVCVEADEIRLAQVFSNLLNNAAKYTDQGGRIWLDARQQGNEVFVSVRDTGIGIPADKLTHVFEMFAQIDRSLEQTRGGLGIGLTLVRRLVDLHGGSIEAKSEGAGQGSEFIVRLPIVAEDQTPEALPSPGNGQRALPTSSLRILVVDDNRSTASSLEVVLRTMGNDIRIAHDGEAALAAAEHFKPNVALLDIGLPKLNGYEVCRRIRREPWGRAMVLIALTGWGREEDRRTAEQAGFDYHMVKPVDPEAVMRFLAGVARDERGAENG